MKKLAIIAILLAMPVVAWAVDSKLTALTQLPQADNDDLIYVVDDANGTPVERKIPREEFLITWIGSTNITTLGTITSGTWQGTTVAVDQGGTGATTLSDGFLLLGNATGAIQALDVTGDGSIVIGDGATDPTTLAAFTSSTGTLKNEYGGIEADVSGYATGLFGMITDTPTDIDTPAELETAAGLGAFFSDYADDADQATMQTTLGLGTGDSPQFTAVNIGHASDTTVERASAGDLNIESNIVYRAGGTDVPVTDGGTGRSTSTTAYGLIAAGTTATGTHQTLAAGLTTQILVGGGASALPAWGTDIPTAVTIGSKYVYRADGTDVPVADGGLGTDVSTFTDGLVGVASGVVTDIDTEGELETALGSIDVMVVATDDFSSANLATALSDETGNGGGFVRANNASMDSLTVTTAFTATDLLTNTHFTHSTDWGDIETDGSGNVLIDADQAITITGDWNFGGATNFELPNSATPTLPNLAGEVALDTDLLSGSTGQGILELHSGVQLTYVVATIGTPADNQVPTFNSTTGVIDWEDPPGAAGGDNVYVDTVDVTDPDFRSTGDIDFVDTSNVITANLNSTVVDFAHLNNNVITGATEDSGFTSGDFLLYSDTADSGNLKKVDYDDLPSGGGGDEVLIDSTAVTDGAGVDLQGGEGIAITFNSGVSPDTASFAVDLTELTGNKTWNDGATDTSFTLTFDLSTGTDPVVTFGDGIVNITTGKWQDSGNDVYYATGTDIPVTDGGTGRSTSTTAYGLIAAGTTATGAHQTLAAGGTDEILVGGGASALPVWTTATGTGAPVRADSATVTTEFTATDLIDVEDLKHEDHGEVDYSTGNAVIDDGLAVSNWNLTTATATTSLTVTDGTWIGIGAGAERITFDGTGDDIEIYGASVGIGMDPTQKFSVGSTSNTYQISMYHNDTDAYISPNEGKIIFQTDKGTNNQTIIQVRGKGTGAGEMNIMDEDNAENIYWYCTTGEGHVEVSGTAPGDLHIQTNANGNVDVFDASASGETKELIVWGYRAADALRGLEIGVGIDAADTASFDGLSTYLFDGTIRANTSLILTGADASPTLAGQIRYDSTITGLADGGLVWYDQDEIRRVVDIDSSEGDFASGDDAKLVRYVWNSGNGYFDLVAQAGGGDMSKSTYDTDTDNLIDQDNGGVELDTSGVTNGQLLIGNTTGNVWALGTITEGLAIDITNGAGSITAAFNPTEMTGARTWNDDTTDASFAWTFGLNAGTDPQITFGDGIINATAGVWQISGSTVYYPGGTDVALADGGMNADLSGYTTGLIGLITGTTTDVDTPAELETAAGLGAFFSDYADDADQAAMQTTLGLGTGDSPQFTAVNIGDASDTTLSRNAAGILQVESNVIPREIDVPGMTSTTPTVIYAFSIHDIDDGVDDLAIQFPRAMTITKVTAMCIGGTNVVGRLYEVDGDGDDVDAVGVETADWTFTTTETEDTSFNNATLDAGDYLQWDTTSVSGSVTCFRITVEGYET